MTSYDFKITRVDTDSIGFCKQDMSAFTEDEIASLTKELNSLYPDGIEWDFDGIFTRMLVVKSKNYVLDDGEKITYKGSSLKDQKKERALIEYLHKLIDGLLNDYPDTKLVSIYHEYIKEAFSVTDIDRWCTKKTVTKTMLESTRLNETKVKDALGNKTVQEGDKIWLYPSINGKIQETKNGEPVFSKKGEPKMKENKILKLKENWDNDIDSMHLVKRIYDTTAILQNVINMELFVNYSKNANKPALDAILKEN